jgi:Na+-translocating ferredoxin:NAD+ oxidoreductase subunit B
MIVAVTSLTALGISLGFILGMAARHFKVEATDQSAEIEAMLPGSQCGQCGYPGCRGAAAAIVKGDAPVTVCPGGGRTLAEALAAKLGVEVDLAGVADAVPMVAAMREDTCIGCIKCFKICPTQAVVGAVKQIHSVLSEACTGCGKCVEICPTESAHLAPVPVTLQSWRWNMPSHAA